jgi:hypothetical protein
MKRTKTILLLPQKSKITTVLVGIAPPQLQQKYKYFGSISLCGTEYTCQITLWLALLFQLPSVSMMIIEQSDDVINSMPVEGQYHHPILNYYWQWTYSIVMTRMIKFYPFVACHQKVMYHFFKAIFLYFQVVMMIASNGLLHHGEYNFPFNIV